MLNGLITLSVSIVIVNVRFSSVASCFTGLKPGGKVKLLHSSTLITNER